jgi:hypothetical protein
MTEEKTSASIDPMEQARRIMKRLSETPHEPHRPLGRRANKNAELTPSPDDRLASKKPRQK